MIPDTITWANLFKDQYFANETGTVGQGNFGIGAIANALIADLPLRRQAEIVREINLLSEQTNKIEANYKQKIADLEELKKSLLTKAFAWEQ